MSTTWYCEHAVCEPYMVTEAILDTMQVAGLPNMKDWAEGVADRIFKRMAKRRCPRCNGPYNPDLIEAPDEPKSRLTAERVVPICEVCDEDEAHQFALGIGYTPFHGWPVQSRDMTRRARDVARRRSTNLLLSAPTGRPVHARRDD